ncbi:PH domain-containing protein [Virgibacillus kekensis]|uniref:PH domain-containing protein n=1 Tax=Virgibacillus kekensis TaxID=202261 RepID=A0ABV9DLY9_9BACI
MSEPKRLHPAAILFLFAKSLREAIFVIVLGFISFKDNGLIYFLLGIGLLLILLVGLSILSWMRYTYRVEGEELRIEYGILIRKKRYISKNRIQSIDLTAGVVHRIFKLTRVQIETAGSGMNAEASLRAVRLSEGAALRSELKTVQSKQSAEVHDETPEAQGPSRKITNKRLFIAGSTSGRVGVVFAILALFFSELEQFIPDRVYDETLNWVVSLSIIFIVGLAVIFLLILWVLGIVGMVIKYGNFTITRNGDELFITRGLLEKKELTIPLKRIQAVGTQKSLIRQPLGYVTVFAEVAGGSTDKNEDFSSILFPIMKDDEVDSFLETFLPDYTGMEDELTRLPSRALKFYIIRSVLPFLIIGGVSWYFFPQFFWAPLLLIVASIGMGILRHRDGGIREDGDRLTIQYRFFSKNRIVLYRRRVQSIERKQHRLHMKQRLATIKLSIIGKMGMGKHFTIKELEEETANQAADWYSFRK